MPQVKVKTLSGLDDVKSLLYKRKKRLNSSHASVTKQQEGVL